MAQGRIIYMVVALILAAFALLFIMPKDQMANNREIITSPTPSKPVLSLPGVDVYEINMPGHVHCFLAVEHSKFTKAPTLSCIKVPALKADPRRWQKKGLPTPDQDMWAGRE